jgi:prophage regulatory protein
MADRVLRESDVARTTGLGRTTRYEMERRGEFPRRRQLTPNAIGWLESEILDWLGSRELRGTKAPSGR